MLRLRVIPPTIGVPSPECRSSCRCVFPTRRLFFAIFTLARHTALLEAAQLRVCSNDRPTYLARQQSRQSGRQG
jgi:hypothetical protein